MKTYPQGAFIAVHGVGIPAPGEIVEELSRLYPDKSYSRSDVVINGTAFARLVPDDERAPHIIEVNWSDIERPQRSVLGAAEWVVALSFALTRAKFEWTKVRLLVSTWNRLFFESVLLWILFPVLLGFANANLSRYALLSADLVVIGLAAITLFINRGTTRMAQVAGTVALGVLVLLTLLLAFRPEVLRYLNPIAVRAYGLAQMFAGVLIFLTAINVAWLALRGELTVHTALARLAFSYLPLVLLSALGSIVWAVFLNLFLRLPHSTDLYNAWQKMFLAHLGYDLKITEWAMAAATAGIGFFAIAALVSYLLAAPARQGITAHRAIYLALIVMPMMLAVPGAAIVATLHFGGLRPGSGEENVWQVYTVSAMRIVPWLLTAVTPITTLLDVLSDVVFYITDRKLRFSSFDACNRRFSLLFEHAQSRYAWVRVVAHSQGSVIAHTTIAHVAVTVPTSLTTIGSPLGTLYGKYLDWVVTPRKGWRNLYRSGDYIGGPVDVPGVNEDIGPGGHTNYWSDVRLLPWLNRPDS